jgi:hypothetical protein
MKSSRNKTFLQFGNLPEKIRSKTSNREGKRIRRGAIRAALCYNSGGKVKAYASGTKPLPGGT